MSSVASEFKGFWRERIFCYRRYKAFLYAGIPRSPHRCEIVEQLPNIVESGHWTKAQMSDRNILNIIKR